MRNSKIVFKIILIFSSFLVGRASDVGGLDLSNAESFYANGDYQNFLESVKGPLTQLPSLKDDIALNAKIAYALFQVKRHEESEIIWKKVLERKSEIRDFYWWNRGLNILAGGDTIGAIETWSLGINENPVYNLVPKMRYYSSEFSAAIGDYPTALNKMIGLYKSRKSAGHGKDFILSQIVKYAHRSDQDSLRNKYVKILLKNYPGSKESYYWLSELKLIENFEEKSSTEQKLFLDILYRNRKYKEALVLIQRLKKLSSKTLKNTADYFWAEIYFNQKKYNSAYNVFNRLPLSQFKLTTQRQILRQKGRCLYRLGQRKASYREFEVLASRFPKWGRSLELLWVAAWDYDKKKQYKNSAFWYNKIIKLNPNSEYAWHSRFRLGFNYYLQGKYKSAITIFMQISKAKIWTLWKDRARYWIAKSKEALNEYESALNIYSELSNRPVANYYTLESYFIVEYLETDNKWTEQGGLLPETGFFAGDMELDLYVDEFKRILEIEKIFGIKEAREDLRKYKVNKSSEISYYMALARLYKKLGEFGLAYRMQLKLVNQYFHDIPLSFQSPIIKYLFPLFYDDYIFAKSEELDVEPEIVFAVMRQESAFQEDAVSRAGASGLLQLMPATARNLHDRIIEEPWDIGRLTEPDYNIQLGVYYLSNLIGRYDGNYPYVFISYNAGPSRLKKWRKRIDNKDLDIFIESIEFKETRSYLRNCMRNYWAYKILLGASPMTLNDYIKRSHSIFGDSSW